MNIGIAWKFLVVLALYCFFRAATGMHGEWWFALLLAGFVFSMLGGWLKSIADDRKLGNTDTIDALKILAVLGLARFAPKIFLFFAALIMTVFTMCSRGNV